MKEFSAFMGCARVLFHRIIGRMHAIEDRRYEIPRYTFEIISLESSHGFKQSRSSGSVASNVRTHRVAN